MGAGKVRGLPKACTTKGSWRGLTGLRRGLTGPPRLPQQLCPFWGPGLSGLLWTERPLLQQLIHSSQHPWETWKSVQGWCLWAWGPQFIAEGCEAQRKELAQSHTAP